MVERVEMRQPPLRLMAMTRPAFEKIDSRRILVGLLRPIISETSAGIITEPATIDRRK